MRSIRFNAAGMGFTTGDVGKFWMWQHVAFRAGTNSSGETIIVEPPSDGDGRGHPRQHPAKQWLQQYLTRYETVNMSVLGSSDTVCRFRVIWAHPN